MFQIILMMSTDNIILQYSSLKIPLRKCTDFHIFTSVPIKMAPVYGVFQYCNCNSFMQFTVFNYTSKPVDLTTTF